MDSSHRDKFPISRVLQSRTLNGDAQISNGERFEAKPGACRLGHEEEQEGVQAGVQATQTHCHFEIHVRAICAVHEELHVMESVQDPGRGEAHEEDDEHQRARLDVHVPVVVGSVQRAHDADVAHSRDHERHQEAEGGQEDVVVEQEEVRVVVQGQHVVAGDAAHLGEPVALPHQELGQDGGAKQAPHGNADPRGVRPLGEAFVLERVHNCHVALGADAGQRLGRAVEVAIETGGDHSTGGLPEHPVVSMEMVLSLEDEGDEEEEVGDGQAAVEDGRGHLSDFRDQRAQDGNVGRHADNHRQHVNGGNDPGAQGAAQVFCCPVAERLQPRSGVGYDRSLCRVLGKK